MRRDGAPSIALQATVDGACSVQLGLICDAFVYKRDMACDFLRL